MSDHNASVFFLAKNYSQYISVVEVQLGNTNLSSSQKCILYSNIASAQLELGLNRKALKSATSAIEHGDFKGSECSALCRAYIVKGKSFLSSGKDSEAVSTWKEGFDRMKAMGIFMDMALLNELNCLITSVTQSTTSNTASHTKIDTSQIESNTITTTVVTPNLEELSSSAPAAISTEDSTTPTTSETHDTTLPATHIRIPLKSTPIKVESIENSSPPAAPAQPTTPTRTRPPAAPAPAQPTTPTPTRTRPPAAPAPAQPTAPTPTRTRPSAEPAPAQPTTTTSSPSLLSAVDKKKESAREALAAFHRKSIGETSQHVIKPMYLNPVRKNLPHICGEPLVDDLVCLAYINVNGGNLDKAASIFQLICNYRSDVPSALIGSGSIAAMQRRFEDAIRDFSQAIELDNRIPDAWKRRGQVYAAKGLVKIALKDLSRAIALQPEGDVYFQRGLVYHQNHNYTRALKDFHYAQQGKMATAALFNYIGMCEGQLGNVSNSLVAHSQALKIQPNFKEAQLNMALMYKEGGDWRTAAASFEKSIQCDTAAPFFQAHGHRGQMFAQLGMVALALKDHTVTINALFTIVVGRGGDNIPDEEKRTRKAELVQSLTRAGLCYQTLGQYQKTVGYLDQALSLQPNNNCWFLREIALFLWAQLDTALELYNVDDAVDPRLKDGWCKHVSWNAYMAPHMASVVAVTKTGKQQPSSSATRHISLGPASYTAASKPSQVPCLYRHGFQCQRGDDSDLLLTSPPAAIKSTTSVFTPVGVWNEERKLQLLRLSAPYTQLIQLNSAGFLPNRRQHRMFGLAVLQIGCTLSKHFALIGLEGIGLAVPNSCSSRNYGAPSSSTGASVKARPSKGAGKGSTKPSPSGKRGATVATHIFNWRDMFDIAVRWRQVSEPGDPVWWIDRFPDAAFQEGFGLQTPLVNGHLRTVRYAPYYQLAFDRVKSILQEEGFYTVQDSHVRLTQEMCAKVKISRTLEDLRNAVGQDFYVVVPCSGLHTPDRVYEGTRLTLVAQEQEGFDFTIRTPGKPHRWAQYEEELNACFHRLEEAFLQRHHRRASTIAGIYVSPSSSSSTVADSTDIAESNDEAVLRVALEMFYLWVTFAPLSRGTAACGYAVFCAVLLSLGRRPANDFLLPAGKQLDWEAILAVDFAVFWNTVKDWFPLTEAGEALITLQHPWASTKSADTEAVVWNESVPSTVPPLGPISSSSGSTAPCATAVGVFDCVRTLRDMLDVLCLPYE